MLRSLNTYSLINIIMCSILINFFGNIFRIIYSKHAIKKKNRFFQSTQLGVTLIKPQSNNKGRNFIKEPFIFAFCLWASIYDKYVILKMFCLNISLYNSKFAWVCVGKMFFFVSQQIYLPHTDKMFFPPFPSNKIIRFFQLPRLLRKYIISGNNKKYTKAENLGHQTCK